MPAHRCSESDPATQAGASGAKLSAARANHMRPRVAAQEKSHVKACRGCAVLHTLIKS
jgi:hypothetical protein